MLYNKIDARRAYWRVGLFVMSLLTLELVFLVASPDARYPKFLTKFEEFGEQISCGDSNSHVRWSFALWWRTLYARYPKFLTKFEEFES